MRHELITYWSRADECFVVEVPELAGCMADGATYPQAVAHAQLVIGQRLETARELGHPIPEPRGKARLRLRSKTTAIFSRRPFFYTWFDPAPRP